jgi:3',5'-cyclic AMP phosphodiesterase CpdA
MRIAYLSDLHHEFEAGPGTPVPFEAEKVLAPAIGADLVVLAGDIDIAERGVERADAIARLTGLPTVYVAGNHEAYGHDLLHLEPRLRQAAWRTDGRVLYLNSNIVRFWFGGELLLVLGCTLWTDYALRVPGAKQGSEQQLQDYKEILYDSAPFGPAQVIAMHKRQKAWLGVQLKRLAADKNKPKILVVTHHAPIPEALGERTAALAMAYASDLRAEIKVWPPLVWVHGHTHHRHETHIGASSVLSAPRGYPVPGGGTEDYACGIFDL